MTKILHYTSPAMKFGLALLLAGLGLTRISAQTAPADTLPKGAWATMEVTNGDTVFAMMLQVQRVTDRRAFKDFPEQRQYYLYYRAAKRVYPYAVQAIDLYHEIQEETQDMGKGKRRRYIRHEHKELKEDFKEKMTSLSKTEGKVLIKMIERELGQPFYDIISETRGGFTATYWNQLGKFWGYDLKEGYHLGNDGLLDEVLIDYDFGAAMWKY